MSEEEAFVAGIGENPLDDLRRLVYADWLEERGRAAEAEYLRLVAVLAAPGTPVEVEHPHAVRLVELAASLPAEWREVVGGRFDVWIDECSRAQLMPFARWLQQSTSPGLISARRLFDILPQLVARRCPWEDAFAVVSTACPTVVCRVLPGGETVPENAVRHRVAFQASVWPGTDENPEGVRVALQNIRRLIASDAELRHLAPVVPHVLPLSRNQQYSFPIASGLMSWNAGRLADRVRARLLPPRGLLGRDADPPFIGLLVIRSEVER